MLRLYLKDEPLTAKELTSQTHQLMGEAPNRPASSLAKYLNRTYAMRNELRDSELLRF